MGMERRNSILTTPYWTMRVHSRAVILLTLALGFSVAACRRSGSSSKARGLEDFVDGTGVVKLGMTEEEVVRALGTQPERRKENEPQRLVELGFRLAGAVPGVAYASFVGGPLNQIEFALDRIDQPPLPRVSREAAQSLTQGALARKALDHNLEMSDVLEAAGKPGRRVAWKLLRSFASGSPHTVTISTWFWEVEPGGKALIVVETDGTPGSPLTRDLPPAGTPQASHPEASRSEAPEARTEGRPGNAPATAAAAGAPAEQVTREELTTFLDWQAEMWDVMVQLQKEAKAAVNDPDPVKAGAEAVKRNHERVDPLLDREPFKDTRKGAAMRAVMSAFYISGSFFRDEKELARLRASYGTELVDSIAGQEALFRDKLKRGWGHP